MVGAHLGIETIQIGLERAEVGNSLAVALHICGATGGERSESQQRLDIAPHPGMVSCAGEVEAEALHGPQHQEIQLASPDLGKIRLDGTAGELMSEGECIVLELEHPGSLALGHSPIRRPDDG